MRIADFRLRIDYIDVISEQQAREKILEAVQPLEPRSVGILQSLDCFAAGDTFARLPLPMFDNSAMDGYAVITSQAKRGMRLRVVGEQPAGADRQLHVKSGTAIRIFTGAPIPAGADAVVMQEDVSREGDEIVLNCDAERGDFIRQRGCDLTEGQKVLGIGERIRATTIGLLASQGIAKVSVGGEPRVAIVSSGDELVEAGAELQPGQIYDSNCAMLQTLVKRSGATVVSVRHCQDTLEAVQRAFESAAGTDALIVTGGVSVGEHDLVQSALRSLGAKIDVWRVAIKPGKPFLFGQMRKTGPSPQSSPSGKSGREATGEEKLDTQRVCLLFGLPGNPVSAFVTFLQFVRPAILKLMGAAECSLPLVTAHLAVDVANEGDRAHYFRGRLESATFHPVGRQESHALFGLSQSNALLRLEPGESRTAGTVVELQVWD